MKYYSTNDKNHLLSAKNAILAGLAPDGGLYMPEAMPKLSPSEIKELPFKSFQEVALTLANPFLVEDVSEEVLKKIIEDAFNFPLPLIELSSEISILELFHGPTLAFKDFAARFMARLMAHFKDLREPETTILVATSGDTGGAVAHGFYNVPGFRVVILYPKGQVSNLQEKQLTTLGENVSALEVCGSFDDCQRIVKEAFVDLECKEKLKLASANSINIARLIPQSFYYAYIWAQASKKHEKIVFSVPSGNLGNVTAGLFAKAMGIPIEHFIVATNANDVVSEYLQKEKFRPRPSVCTISNAMDIGNPSNFVRLSELFDGSVDKAKLTLSSFSFTDSETREAMREVYRAHNYVMDPHGAVGYLGLKKYLEHSGAKNTHGIVIETAHPAKFIDTVEETLGIKVALPSALAELVNKKKVARKISPELGELKSCLL